jgi:PAS domain S-box-containing protein
MKHLDRTATVIGLAIAFGLVFWVLDSLITFYYFRNHLRYMILVRPDTLLDAVILKASAHTLFVRVSFLVMCVIGGALTANYMNRKAEAEASLRQSEEQYRQLVEQSGDAIYLIYEDHFEVVNHRFEELFGPVPDGLDAPPFDFMTLVAPESRPMIQARIDRYVTGTTESTLRYEFTALDRHGDEIEVEVVTSYVPYREGIAVQGVLRDVTARKRAEQERERLLAQIQAQARQMQQIMETVPEAVFLIDAYGAIIHANPVARSWLPLLTASSAPQRRLQRLGDRDLSELLTAPTSGLYHEVEAGNRVFEVVAQPVQEEAPDASWVLLLQDVTREREIQQHLRQQERLSALGQLAAGIAHDFNNIMAVIVLYAQMGLRVPDLPTKLRERLEIITQQANRATELIQQILDFSRRAVLERRPLDLQVFLKEQVQLLERTLPENIRVTLTLEEDTYLVSADPTRLQQAIMNLTINAREAMPRGGEVRFTLQRVQMEEATVRLPQQRPGPWVCLTVEDTGKGIPPAVLPHIFEPFFTTKAPRGTGLGLAQVYGIVKQHKGHIDVQSTPGEGTTFTLYLPAMTEDAAPMATAARQDYPRGHGERILIVEDDAPLRDALTESLQALNYRTLTAQNGEDALRVLARQGDEVALILSDLVMPQMGGGALFEALRARGLRQPVILLTGHPMEQELKRLKAQGVAAWLLKPPDIARLARVVARTLAAHSVSTARRA